MGSGEVEAGCVFGCELNGGGGCKALCGWMHLCVCAAYLECLLMVVSVVGCVNACR